MERKEEKRCGVKLSKLDSQDIVLDISQEFGPVGVESFMASPPKLETRTSRSQKRKERKEHSLNKLGKKPNELKQWIWIRTQSKISK